MYRYYHDQEYSSWSLASCSAMCVVHILCICTQSQVSAKMGHTEKARNQGLVAAYLNAAAVIIAFLVALLATGLAIGLYAPVYYLEQCRDKVESKFSFIVKL